MVQLLCCASKAEILALGHEGLQIGKPGLWHDEILKLPDLLQDETCVSSSFEHVDELLGRGDPWVGLRWASASCLPFFETGIGVWLAV